MMTVGVVLWQVVELSSLSVVSQRVDQAKPLLGGVRLALIGLLARILHKKRGQALSNPL